METETTKVENQSAVNQEVNEEKKSNRVFTQSEFDQRLAEEQKKIAEKFGDYSQTKEQLQQLLEEKKKREEAEMTEIEKLSKQNEELNNNYQTLQQQLKEKEKALLKTNVLSSPEFATLPQIYKGAVQGETVEEITENAKKIFEQFQNDIGSVKSTDNALPPNINRNSVEKAGDPTTPRDKIIEALKKKMGV